jgi:hypothetical protein
MLSLPQRPDRSQGDAGRYGTMGASIAGFGELTVGGSSGRLSAPTRLHRQSSRLTPLAAIDHKRRTARPVHRPLRRVLDSHDRPMVLDHATANPHGWVTHFGNTPQAEFIRAGTDCRCLRRRRMTWRALAGRPGSLPKIAGSPRLWLAGNREADAATRNRGFEAGAGELQGAGAPASRVDRATFSPTALRSCLHHRLEHSPGPCRLRRRGCVFTPAIAVARS